MVTNDFVLTVATVNGSGSQSANTVLVKSLFRMGLPVSGKNLFPSNIAGLPTWFTIRVNEKRRLSRRPSHDILIGMNAATALEDIRSLKPGGVFIYNADLKIPAEWLRSDVINCAIPFRQLLDGVTDSVKLKKLLTNMAYVGVVGALIGADRQTVHEVVRDQFSDKPAVIELNEKAIAAGYAYADQNLDPSSFPFQVRGIPGGNHGHILIDGNSASALGLVYGGCTFLSWYPITPSSSLAEGFQRFAARYRLDEKGRRTYAVVQAEDELSAISMVLGAGWAGARSVTATSGPGLSLMAEAAGLSYFAEIPGVIWDVQRVGPSTGLPTRTLQGDLLSALTLSHGDTQHVVLLPGTPAECFEFGQTCFDLAERLQTLVIVLSDLDLGMNLWITPEFTASQRPFDRGKILKKQDLEKVAEFARYKDIDGDGIPYRTLPGTHHAKAAYFTRGTGHDEKSGYTESHVKFRELMDRLARKYETAKRYVPPPIVEKVAGARIAFVGFGSSDVAIQEARQRLSENGVASDSLRLRALPLTDEAEAFLSAYETVYIVEQNRDGQLLQILKALRPDAAARWHSVRQYDGLPLAADHILSEMGHKDLLS